MRYSDLEHDDNGDYVLIRVIEGNNDPKRTDVYVSYEIGDYMRENFRE